MKRFLIVPVLLLFTLAVNAQIFTIFGKDVGFIYIGPKIGATYSNISNYSEMFGVKSKSQLAYQFGAIGEFGFTSKFSIQTELLFYSRGAALPNDMRIKMNYIGLPILAKYSFKFLGLQKVYAMGGTFEDIRTKGEWVDPVGTQPLGTGFKKYDFGLSFGAGAEYPTDKGIWALDLRYNFGLTDLHDGVGDNVKTRSRSLGLSLTYKFDIIDLFSGLGKKKKDGSENEEGGSKSKPGLKVDRSR
jgi:opacity protein-like surface antigen